MTSYGDYCKDEDRVLERIQEMEIAIGNIMVRARNQPDIQDLASYLKDECDAIKNVYRIRHLDCDMKFEEMAKNETKG